MIQLKEGTDEFKTIKTIKAEWGEAAHAVTIDTLPEFLTRLTTDYRHDYGTICHAMAIAAVAAASAVDRSPQGGITGYQAGAVMWEFVRAWNHSSNKTGLRMIDYDNLLYPQYKDHYRNTIAPAVWASLKEAAADMLRDADTKYAEYQTRKAQYQRDLDAFVRKYPDYYERRDHYERLRVGTQAEWEAEKAKGDSGFEFAPQKPYEPVRSDSPVYRHWKSITQGQVPFGFTVEEN